MDGSRGQRFGYDAAMPIFRTLVAAVAMVGALAPFVAAQPRAVGPSGSGATTVTTGQLVRPAGLTVQIPARPVDLALSPDGRFLFVKENKGITVMDAAVEAGWSVRTRLALGSDAASMTGIAVSLDGASLYVTD